MAGAQHHVSLRGLTHVFRDGRRALPAGRRALTALADVTLDVAWGQFVSVIGPSGCGKSTLLRIVGGLLRPTSGEAKIDGAAPAAAQRRRAIGLVAPDVALARALAFAPSLRLMDEPFGALDEISRASMRYELLRIWQTAPSGRKTVMFVTHSIPEAIALSDRVVVLSPRPGSVRAAIDVELPRPRTQEMERGAPFLDYADQLAKLLKEVPAGARPCAPQPP